MYSVPSSPMRSFLIVEGKSLDLELMGRKVEGLKLSENGKGYRSSITLWERK